VKHTPAALQQAHQSLSAAVAGHRAAQSGLSKFNEAEQARRRLEAQRTLEQAIAAAGDLAQAASAEAGQEIENIAMRLDVADISDLLPVGRMGEAAQRSSFINDDCMTMSADMLLRRLTAVTEGSDQVSRLLHHRYASRRLLALAEAGQLTMDPGGKPAVPPGASEHLGLLVGAVASLRASLDGPAEKLARQQAESLAVAAGDLQAEAIRISFAVERYGSPGVALSR